MAKEGGSSKEAGNNWIGFDLGGTKMLAVVFDENFQAIGKSRKKTKGFEGMEAGLKKITAVIAEAIATTGTQRR